MPYTTVDKVAALFPGMQRNAANSVSDDMIQDFIDEWAADINAILKRRFAEAISAMPGGSPDLQFAAWTTAFNDDQVKALQKINRYGAASELDHAFEVVAPGFAASAKEYGQEAEAMLRELDGRDSSDKAKPDGGRYDKLFDPLAKTATPRPQFGGFPGTGISPDGEAADFAFKKWQTPESDVDAGQNEDAVEQAGEKGE